MQTSFERGKTSTAKDPNPTCALQVSIKLRFTDCSASGMKPPGGDVSMAAEEFSVGQKKDGPMTDDLLLLLLLVLPLLLGIPKRKAKKAFLHSNWKPKWVWAGWQNICQHQGLTMVSKSTSINYKALGRAGPTKGCSLKPIRHIKTTKNIQKHPARFHYSCLLLITYNLCFEAWIGLLQIRNRLNCIWLGPSTICFRPSQSWKNYVLHLQSICRHRFQWLPAPLCPLNPVFKPATIDISVDLPGNINPKFSVTRCRQHLQLWSLSKLGKWQTSGFQTEKPQKILGKNKKHLKSNTHFKYQKTSSEKQHTLWVNTHQP